MAENDERLRYDAALELRGESAAGSADRWLKGARAFMSETGSSLDPESRKNFERRATYLIQGKYENLKRHEAREVRAGRIARLETETADSAAREANDILMQTQSLENSLGGETRLAGLVRDEAMKNAGDDKEKQKAAEEAYAQRMGGLFLRRKADSERLIVQIGATTMMNEDRFQNAVDQGLFDQPTADALRRKYQRTVMDTTVGTLLQGGQADQAEAFVAALEDNDRALALSMGYTPEDVAKMRSGVEAVRAKRTAGAERAKEEAESRALASIAIASREARADGSLGALESAQKLLAGEAGTHPKGSRLRVAAMEEANRLDAAADAAAVRETWDAIVDHADDGVEWKPPKGTRMARHYKALKESYDRQRAAYMAEGMLAADAEARAVRRDAEAALRAGMLAAASVNPGEFSSVLAEKAEKGEISLDQYRRLRDEFRDTWMKEGMPKKAKALVDILKREFYAGKDYDLSDRLAADPKTGRFGYLKNPDTKKPFEGEDVEYGAQVLVPYDPNSWGGLKDFIGINRAPHYATETRKLTSDEQLELLNIALDLAKHDGDETHIDPLTREPLEKPRVLNAADEFQRACTMLRKMKQAESAADRIQRFAEAQAEVESGFGRFERGKVAAAEKREAQEDFTRQALKAAKRKPFAPKMPGASGGSEEAGNGGQETED